MLLLKQKCAFSKQINDQLSIGSLGGNGNIVFQVQGDWEVAHLTIHLFKDNGSYQMERELPRGIDGYIEHFQESERIYLIYIYNMTKTQLVVYKLNVELKWADIVYENLKDQLIAINGHILELGSDGQLRVLIRSKDIILKRTFQNISSIDIMYRKKGNLVQTTNYINHIEYYTIPELKQVHIEKKPPRVLKRQFTLFIKEYKRQRNITIQLKWFTQLSHNQCYFSKNQIGIEKIIDIHGIIRSNSKILHLKHQPKLLRIFKKYYPDTNYLPPKFIINSSERYQDDVRICACDITTAEEQSLGLYDNVKVIDGYLFNQNYENNQELDYYHVYEVELH